MTRVDESYSYDELDGFEQVNVRCKQMFRGCWLSMRDQTLSLSGDAKRALGKEYLRIAINREKRLLLIEGAGPEFADAVFYPERNKAGVSCSGLAKLLERECRYDLSVVRIRIPGNPAKSRKNAVVFDLNKAQTEKIQKSK